MKLKVLSWNIWVDGFLQKWENLLLATAPDIIGLQEVQDHDPERDIINVLKRSGYNHFFAQTEQVWDGKTYRHGPAIFSKFPIVSSEKIQLERGDGERAAAYAQINVDGTMLNVFSTHLLHTHQQPSEQQVEQTNRLIAKLPPHKVIVMGDFNATPDSSAIRTMCNVLLDTDQSSQATWSVYPEGCDTCNPQAIETKLDYIFVSKDLNAHSFQVERSDGSDHLPISVIIEV